jgi:tRNA 2-thiocytidine biosynthesis protein TtcA
MWKAANLAGLRRSAAQYGMNERERMARELGRLVGRCVADWSLIADGDRIMVCSSGGKDSYVMLDLLERLRRRAPVRFELLAVHLDQGYPGQDTGRLEAWLRDNGFRYRVLSEDIFGIVSQKVPEGEITCALCSRLRRGILYSAAQQLGCNKLALGHNRDDAIETLLLNLLFTGSIKAMPARLRSDDGRNLVIRPLLYCAEEAIIAYAGASGFPVVPCGMCNDEQPFKRARVKKLLAQLEELAPQAKNSIFAALGNVRATHLLDRELWRRLGIEAAVEPPASTGGEAERIEPGREGQRQR